MIPINFSAGFGWYQSTARFCGAGCSSFPCRTNTATPQQTIGDNGVISYLTKWSCAAPHPWSPTLEPCPTAGQRRKAVQSSPGQRGAVNTPGSHTPGWLCSWLDPAATSGSQILNSVLSCEVSEPAPIVLLQLLPNSLWCLQWPMWLTAGSPHSQPGQESILSLTTAAHTDTSQAKVCSFFSTRCLQIPYNKTRSQPIWSECFQSHHLQDPRDPTCSLSFSFKHSLLL